MVGERERLVAELGRANGQFLGQRSPVQKRIRRMAVELDVPPSAEKPDRVQTVERTVAGSFRYELVSEAGESLGDLSSEKASWEVGDLVPCSGHMFEIRAIEDTTASRPPRHLSTRAA